MGTFQLDNSVLDISPGTGYRGIPFRTGAPREITAVTLRRATVAGLVMGVAPPSLDSLWASRHRRYNRYGRRATVAAIVTGDARAAL